jgi:PIN domain nuclease of toxin-antitoxin system
VRKRRSRSRQVQHPGELQDYDGPLLLDTHVWVWYLAGEEELLSADTVALLERSAGSAALAVSDISYWEVALKTARGRLSFSVDASIWLKRAEAAPGIRLLPLERDVLLLSTRLADSSNNDPADRMIMATALLHGVPLVTADRRIIGYAEEHGGISVVDARTT